jgi:nucleoside-diphosphate-sugar epimerase
MPRALVTGGTGFLGSHLARSLLGAGWEVRALDVHPPTAELAREVEFVEADVRDAEAVGRAASGCEVVVDNAALVPVTRSTREEFRSVNVDGCRNTLDAARAQGAYALHVSSSSIYGVPHELPVTEATPLRPFEPYGESKAAAEQVVRRERERGLVVASLRSRALVGEGRLGLFEVVFRRVRAGKRIPLFGNGDIRIQLCDAEDFCRAALACIERRASGDYNVGSSRFGTVRQDLEALIAHAGTGARLQPIPVWAIRAVLRPLHLVGKSPLSEWHWVSPATPFYADVTKAMQELGWLPRRSNAEALAGAYDLWLATPEDVGASGHRRPLGGAVGRLLRG